jgi:protein-S-isoprenylcysteine O-methyltransferase Ste14
VLPILLAIPFVVVRIIAEENLLRGQAEYLTYADAVKWRLVPGLW